MLVAFWLGVALVGLLALAIDAIVVAELLDGHVDRGIEGALFWTTIVVVIVHRYGLRSAVALDVDGDDLVWRAPMRTIRVPLADVAATEAGQRSLLGERPMTIVLRDGATLRVSVPNARHASLLAGFLGTLPRQPADAGR